MNHSTCLSNLSEAFKRYGVLNGLLYLINRAYSRMTHRNAVIHRYYFVGIPTNVSIPMPKRLGLEYRTNLLQEDQILNLDVPRPRAVLENRIGGQSQCLAVYRKNEFAGFIWFRDDSYMEDEVNCRYIMPANQFAVWDYDMYIVPKFRNTAAFLKIWQDTVSLLQRSGKRWSISRISAFAPESLRAHLRLGAIPLGSAFFINMIGFQLMLSNVRPYFHLTWRNKYIPEVKIQIPDS